MDTQPADTSPHRLVRDLYTVQEMAHGNLEYSVETFDRSTGTETRNIPKRGIRLVGCRAAVQLLR